MERIYSWSIQTAGKQGSESRLTSHLDCFRRFIPTVGKTAAGCHKNVPENAAAGGVPVKITQILHTEEME
ncbi:MAG: hypothetical protein ACOX8F_03485 [Sakamotonia sp.]|jgi:hypothetical protein